MSGVYPWLVEERVDTNHLLLRCSEMDDGCGDVTEIAAQRTPLRGRAWPGYVQWWHQHARCNEAAAAAFREQAQQHAAQERRQCAAEVVRYILFNLIPYGTQAKAKNSGLSDKDLAGLVRTALSAETLLAQGRTAQRIVPTHGLVKWHSEPLPAIWMAGKELTPLVEGPELFALAREVLAIPLPPETPGAAESEAAHA